MTFRDVKKNPVKKMTGRLTPTPSASYNHNGDVVLCKNQISRYLGMKLMHILVHVLQWPVTVMPQVYFSLRMSSSTQGRINRWRHTNVRREPFSYMRSQQDFLRAASLDVHFSSPKN